MFYKLNYWIIVFFEVKLISCFDVKRYDFRGIFIGLLEELKELIYVFVVSIVRICGSSYRE